METETMIDLALAASMALTALSALTAVVFGAMAWRTWLRMRRGKDNP